MEGCPKLLNLIPKDREWHVRDKEGRNGVSEDKKLELRLGPPGEALFSQADHSLLSLAHFSSTSSNNNNFHGAKRGFEDTIEAKTRERNWLTNNTEIQCQMLSSTEKPIEKVISSTWSCGPLPSSTFSACQKETQKLQQQPSPSFLQLNYPLISKSLAAMADEPSKPCCSRVAELQYQDKKACSIPAKMSVSANTAVPSSSHKRIAPAQVVGWPPIRSFRKNLAYSSSPKPASESSSDIPKVVTNGKSESCRNDLFVKINMDGIPIGRKVDLKAYESYEKLSSAVDELFRGLLAAQRDSSAAGGENNMEEAMITGLLEGNGEYTLVYEDNEGDRMLVGDVPWHMFVSTVKRLRVLKRSELSALHLCSSKQENTPLDSAMEFGK